MGGGGVLRKHRISKQFVLRKIKKILGIIHKKITKHCKNKNDKDEIGNILLKHVFTGL